MPAERDVPRFRQIVLDTIDARGLAAFYRELLNLPLLPDTDEPEDDWLVLGDGVGGRLMAFQRVPELPPVTWPEGPVPQQMHLDFSVPDRAALDAQHDRAMALGARLMRDCADDPEEAIRIYADPAGHPFCLFIPN